MEKGFTPQKPKPKPVKKKKPEEELYEVEELLDVRSQKGQIEYLTKYVGYDDPQDVVWTPEFIGRKRNIPLSFVRAFERKNAPALRSAARKQVG